MSERIPVHTRYGVQHVEPARAAVIARAANAETVRRRDGRLMRIVLYCFSDDPSGDGADRIGVPAYSHDHETPKNPQGVWTFRRLCPTIP